MAKILLSAHTSSHKDYCMKQWINWIIKDFSHYDYDILIVDNSKDSEYHKKIQDELGGRGIVLHLPFDKKRNTQHTIAESNEMIRDYFKKGNYEFLFFNESDVFAPKHTIEYLIEINKYVVGLPYFIFHHYQSKMISHIPERVGYKRDAYLKTLEKSFIDFNGQVIPATNIGLGVLLVHRGVLDMVDFKIPKDVGDDNLSHSDTFFHSRIAQKGIPVYQVQKHFALHLNSNWKEVKRLIDLENE